MEADRTSDEHLSLVDTACLRIEDRTSLIVNVGAMVFAQPLDLERVTETLGRRFLAFPRFRQRVVFPGLPLGTPHWEDDPLFDLRSHLHRIALPAPGDDPALAEVLSDLMSTPLDRAIPLWQVHLIENYRDGCVLLFRLHHCLADGMALLQVLRAITDRSPESPRPPRAPARRPPWDENRLQAVVNLLTAGVHSLLGGTEVPLQKGAEALLDSVQGRDLARTAADAATTLSRLLLMEPDSATVFKGRVGVAKRVAWSTPQAIREVKAVGRFYRSSVNEVLLAAVTGALRYYLQHRGEPVSGVNLRVSIPVKLRPGGSAQGLGNHFSLNLLALPVDRSDPVERLDVVRQRLRDLKESSEAEVILGLMNLYGMAPAEVGNLAIYLLSRKVTAVLSSVPGPPRLTYFAGQPIRRMIFWVPQSGRLGLGLSLLTYQGVVSLGVVSDAGLVPDPGSIVQGFQDEWARLIETLPPAARARGSGGEIAEGRSRRRGSTLTR